MNHKHTHKFAATCDSADWLFTSKNRVFLVLRLLIVSPHFMLRFWAFLRIRSTVFR